MLEPGDHDGDLGRTAGRPAADSHRRRRPRPARGQHRAAFGLRRGTLRDCPLAPRQDAQDAARGACSWPPGAAGLTVAKVGEAGDGEPRLAAAFLHYPVYGADAWRRLADVAAATSLAVAVDSYEAAGRWRRRWPMPTELRCLSRSTSACIAPASEARRRRARSRSGSTASTGSTSPGSALLPGRVRGPSGDIERKLADVEAILAQAVDVFDRAGLRRDRVSGGCTPAMTMTHLTPTVNELQAGTYVFLDRTEVPRRTLSEFTLASTPPSSRRP